MKTKNRWISMRQLKAHEFHCMLRYLKKSDKTWSDIYLRLGEISNDALTKYLKTASSLFVIYILLSSLAKNGQVTVKALQYEASVPVAYVLAVASVFLLISFQHLITVITLSEIRMRESQRLRLARFSSSSFGLYNGQDEMALATPIAVSNFFKDSYGLFGLLSSFYMFALSVSLAPILGFIVYLISWQIDAAFYNPRTFLEGLTALVSLAVTFISLFYFLLFLTPIPMQKHSFGIRWGFLSFLHPPGQHPQMAKWLEEDEKPS